MALGTIKDTRAVEPLITALKDEKEDVRYCVAEALGEIKDARAVDTLIAATLKDEARYVRMYAAFALGKIQDADAVENLIAGLKDNNIVVRENAVWALAWIKDAHAVEPLIAVLNNNNYSDVVRKNAAWGLGWIKDTRAVEPLITALKDEKEDVRKKAAEALGEIKDARAIEPLSTVLKDEKMDARRSAAEALEKIGDKRAINPLVENLCVWDTNSCVAKALSNLGWKPQSDRDRIHFLVAQRNSSKLRTDWNTTKDVLLKDVESNDYLIIGNALYALIGIGKEEIIPELIKKLNEKGSKTTAEAYLNCGNSELSEAAREWASRRGYPIMSGAGNAPVGWGSMR